MRKSLLLTVSAGFLLVGGPSGWPSVYAQTSSAATTSPTLVMEQKTTSAVVEEVDPQTHQILLRLPDDTLLTLKAGPHAGNLSGVKPGDHITAQYTEAKLLGIKQASGNSRSLQTISNGQGDTAQGDTTVVAVDPTGHSVSFIGPDNVVQTVHVSGDAMIQAVTKLQAGDRIDVAYTPAIAVALNGT